MWINSYYWQSNCWTFSKTFIFFTIVGWLILYQGHICKSLRRSLQCRLYMVLLVSAGCGTVVPKHLAGGHQEMLPVLKVMFLSWHGHEKKQILSFIWAEPVHIDSERVLLSVNSSPVHTGHSSEYLAKLKFFSVWNSLSAKLQQKKVTQRGQKSEKCQQFNDCSGDEKLQLCWRKLRKVVFLQDSLQLPATTWGSQTELLERPCPLFQLFEIII